jgi:hypothetical protein
MRREELIAAYDELLRSRAREVVAYVEAAQSKLRRIGSPTGYALPLRPVLFTPAEIEAIEGSVARLVDLVGRVPRAVFGGDLERLARALRLPRLLEEWVKRLVRPDARYAYGRPDAFIWDGRVQIIEQNITSGIGGYEHAELFNEVLGGLPVFDGLPCALTPLSPIAAFEEAFARLGSTPIGFLDSVDVSTGEVFDQGGIYLVGRLRKAGIDVRYLDHRGGWQVSATGVEHEGQRIPVVFRNFPGEELWDRLDELAPLIEACSDGRAVMVDSPFDIVMMNKVLLAYLSDPDERGLFLGDEEAAFVDTVLPWTRRVRDGDTDHRGRRRHLPTLLLEQQQLFVLKKGNGWGGHSVVMGNDTDAASWSQQVGRAMTDGDWIAQEIVACPETQVPFCVNGEIVFSPTLQMASPLWIGSRVGGFLCRTSLPGGARVLATRKSANATAGATTAFIHAG